MVEPHGITVEEWHQTFSAQNGGDDRAELLDGEVFEPPAPTPEHAGCVNRLSSLLVAEIGDRGVVSIQNPVRLDDRSEPRPDVAILAPRPDTYSERHATPEDILLIIEVSDSPMALIYDRGRKASHYAHCGVGECWVVDLKSEQVLLMRAPASGGYRDIRNIRRGASPLQPEALPGITLPIEEILGF